ncbi:recombinase family protein [Dubosiella newyorkensis]|uniref:recombinase family protein n=1 Tax=Dubosiella newyorkensis TaxID=1862672 RepID=UPI0034E5E610
MKRARILLRVSSSQQLEADGDLTVQRQLVQDYIFSHEDWVLDEKEYFEGSSSGYKNPVANRNVLQDALQDARNKEYDILVAYKDDRIGRLMWEIGAYVMELKSYGVDIYTVKDGCISPSQDDIMGQIMLALRYGNAQKSSADTGVRVKVDMKIRILAFKMIHDRNQTRIEHFHDPILLLFQSKLSDRADLVHVLENFIRSIDQIRRRNQIA